MKERLNDLYEYLKEKKYKDILADTLKEEKKPSLICQKRNKLLIMA